MKWEQKSESLKAFEAGDLAFEQKFKDHPEVHHQWAYARQIAGEIIGSNVLGRGKTYKVELAGNVSPDTVEKVPETRQLDPYERRTPNPQVGDSISVTVTQKGDAMVE